MLDHILSYFPPRTHPLTLVSDPDGVLLGEEILAALMDRGFRVINERDPIALRYQIQHALPFTVDKPVIVVTDGPLNTLPYDLWQQGHHVTLDLHRLFPNLAYPILHELSPRQREKLWQVQTTVGVPEQPLSQRETMQYLLQHVFGITHGPMLRPAEMIAWLDEYHKRNDPMPPVLAHSLLSQLKRMPAFANWPLDDMLASAEAYHQFVQNAWMAYLQERVQDRSAAYDATLVLPFDSDTSLQDIMPRLVRSGTLTPVAITSASEIPDWAQPAIVNEEDEIRPHQLNEGLQELEQQLAAGELRWEQWQVVARLWAQLTVWRYDPNLRHRDESLQHFNQVEARLDEQFYEWLSTHYASLAIRALPKPHHLHHVPSWIAYRRQQETGLRSALLVLDGMSLADWLQIREVWQARNPNWAMQEGLILAQIPSITAISRQALISGRRPNQFSESLLHNRQEAHLWATFWQEQGLPAASSSYAQLPTTSGGSYPDVIDSRRTQALCLVSPIIDEMIHGATLGTSDLQASVAVWLNKTDAQHQGSLWLEALIQRLLNHGYTITVTSDHGHVEARGMRQPQEGVVVVSRSKRARIYNDGDIARKVQSQYPDTILWHDDGLLPSNIWVLMPQGRRAFAPMDAQIVSHGGLTIDEMVVPLVTITKS
jgi:hypothetical protein